MPPATTLNSDEFDPTADEQFAMNLLRADNEGLGTQDVLGLQRELFNRIRAPPNQIAAGNANVNRSPERDVYDLPSPSPPRFASPQRVRPPLRLIDLLAEGSSSPLEHWSDNTPSSQRSASSEEPALAQDTDIAMFNPPIVRHDAPTNTGVDLEEFTLFHKLSLELREMIWEASIQPRLVVVRDTKATRDYFEGRRTDERVGDFLFSTTPIPGTLFACQESRKAMLSCGYKLQFRRKSVSFLANPHGCCVWYNNEYDTLYLGPLEPGAQTLSPLLQTDWQYWNPTMFLKRVAVVLRSSYRSIDESSKLKNWYEQIGYPEEVLVVVDHNGVAPLNGGFHFRQSAVDPWTYLSIEDGATVEGAFPKGSSLDARFGHLRMFTSAEDFFQKRCAQVQDTFAEENKRLASKGLREMGAPASVSCVMIVKTSQAQAIIRARKDHSRELKELEENKRKKGETQRRIEESLRILHESKRVLAEVKGKVEKGELRVKDTHKSVEQSLLVLHNLA